MTTEQPQGLETPDDVRSYVIDYEPDSIVRRALA
jgi:hypothetical protein